MKCLSGIHNQPSAFIDRRPHKDEYVALRAIYSGTQTGEVGPFPPGGKRVELPFIGMLRFAEGKVSEMWVEWDNIVMLTQLGQFPPNGRESE